MDPNPGWAWLEAVGSLPPVETSISCHLADPEEFGDPARRGCPGGSGCTCPRAPEGLDDMRVRILHSWCSAKFDDPDLDLIQRRRRTELVVVIDAATLAGLNDEPGEIPGAGAIPADLARRLALGADWRAAITHPVTGHLLDLGRTTYRPTADLIDFIVSRDRTCLVPSCTRPAARCDIDHHHPWDDGGSTCPANLGALCRHHHLAKTHHGFGLIPDDCETRWTLPTGHEHVEPRTAQLPHLAPARPKGPRGLTRPTEGGEDDEQPPF